MSASLFLHNYSSFFFLSLIYLYSENLDACFHKFLQDLTQLDLAILISFLHVYTSKIQPPWLLDAFSSIFIGFLNLKNVHNFLPLEVHWLPCSTVIMCKSQELFLMNVLQVNSHLTQLLLCWCGKGQISSSDLSL